MLISVARIWKLTLLLLCIYESAIAAQSSYEVDVKVVIFKKSDWNLNQVKNQVDAANKVYSQCGVALRPIYINALEPSEVSFDLEGYSDPLEARGVNGSLILVEKYSDPNRPTIFFMQGFDPQFAGITATSMPQIRVQQKDQRPALNSAWISYQIQRLDGAGPGEGGYNPGYNVVAHELGHVLLNADHENDSGKFNLMHSDPQNLNGRLTLEQCQKIQASKMVKRIQNKSVNCAGINSPISNSIFFLDGELPDCKSVGEVTRDLERVQDEVSDLAPISPIDFYMSGPSDLIQFLDRNAFEASLRPSFDQAGRIQIEKSQQEVLWRHELGHARQG